MVGLTSYVRHSHPSDPKDSSPRPATGTINDALSKLIDLGELLAESGLQFLAPPAPGRPTYFCGLSFRSVNGYDALFALPISKGCWVTDTVPADDDSDTDRN